MKRTKRFLITLALLLTAVVQGAWADVSQKTVYLDPAIWDASDAEEAYAAYAYAYADGVEPAWYDMTKVAGTSYYKADIPTTYTGLIFTRRQAGVDMAWGNVWNQAMDINFAATDDNTLFTITSWGEGESPRSTFSTSIYVAWDYASKSGTLTMPAGDVTLTPVYAPTAEFTTEPAAVVGPIYAGSTTALVTAGTVASIGETENKQGTVMYYATQQSSTAPDYDTEGWSENVPTAKDFNDGEVYVWYYIKGADAPEGQTPTAENTFSDSEISSLYLTLSDDENIEVQVPGGEYATFYSNKALKLDDSDTDSQLYTITAVNVDDNKATATVLTVAAANTPILVKNNASETRTIKLIPTEDTPNAVTVYEGFKGTLDATQIAASTATQNNYALNGQQFVWVKDDLSIAANKAWLEVPASGQDNTRSLSIDFGDGTTGIGAISSSAADSGDYYDLQGHKVEKPDRKGIYLKNGKKVIIK